MEQEIKKLPKHLAFIVDGNGRWAKQRGLVRSMGHKAGFNRLQKILKECFYDYKIPYVSCYCFSTENWNRPKDEVNYLIDLFYKYLTTTFMKKFPNVRFNIIGDYTAFPEKVAKRAERMMELTKNNTEFTLNLALNYSGQDELVHAMNNIIAEGIEKVDRKTIEDHLYTAGQPPVDFCIRTSGEQRLSNFMLWQLAYAELYFPKTYFPAFSSKNLKSALLEYQNRDRRFGAIKK